MAQADPSQAGRPGFANRFGVFAAAAPRVFRRIGTPLIARPSPACFRPTCTRLIGRSTAPATAVATGPAILTPRRVGPVAPGWGNAPNMADQGMVDSRDLRLGGVAGDACELSRRILRIANQGVSRADFLRHVSEMLRDFTRCDALEIWLVGPELKCRWELVRQPGQTARFVLAPPDAPTVPPDWVADATLLKIARDVLEERCPRGEPPYTAHGSFFTSDAHSLPAPGDRAAPEPPGTPYRSLALIRFLVDDSQAGLLMVKHLQPGRLNARRVALLEAIAQTVGLALSDRRAQYALRERVKELTCLYGIARVVEDVQLSLDEQLRRIVELLPPAWQFPDVAAARIVLDGREFCTPGFGPSPFAQRVELKIQGVVRGCVELHYMRDRPEFAEGPFLPEEQRLIEKIGQEIEQLVRHHESEAERESLYGQLRHADRLATIGQLAAGVGHELNEPLANILGFAQLLRRDPALPASAHEDLEKIIAAALHAREVIRKLLLFARQTPQQRGQVYLNQLVHDGLYFLEARCKKQGVELVRELADGLPAITADPALLTQVLVNLVVNAIQAMPDGGRLTVRTRPEPGYVVLAIEDTGVGMSADVLRRIFDPFFTTKDVGEGTGLGLSVAHGIISAHGGRIDVRSAPGQGSCFEVRLPLQPPAGGEPEKQP